MRSDDWRSLLILLAANHIATQLTCFPNRMDLTGYIVARDRVFWAGDRGNPYIRALGRRLPVMVAWP